MYYINSPSLNKNFKAKGKTILFSNPDQATMFMNGFLEYAIDRMLTTNPFRIAEIFKVSNELRIVEVSSFDEESIMFEELINR